MGNNKYKQAHRDKGLCQDCSCIAWPFTRCLKHRTNQKKFHKKYDPINLANRRANSMCVSCGRQLDPEMDEQMSHCIFCRERETWKSLPKNYPRTTILY